MAAQSNVIVKLSLKDAEVVRRGLEALGADGEKALRRIDAAGRAPSAGLRALGAASDELKGKLGGLSGQTGSLGNVLSTLGPRGLAAAAGIGAIALALLKAMDAGRQAIDYFSRLNDAASRIGMNVEGFQAFSIAALKIGVSAEQSEKALTKLNGIIGQVMQDGADAPKEVKQAFDALGISMADVQKHGDDLDWMLAAMAEGFAGVKTQAEQTTIAKALFGREGAKLIPLLQEGAEKLREEQEAARAAGAVLSEDLVKAYDALGDRLDLAQKKLEVQKGRIFPEAAAAATRYGEKVADAAETFADFLDDVRQELGPSVFDDIVSAAVTVNMPGGPLMLLWGSIKGILADLRAMRAGAASTGDAMTDDLVASSGVTPVYGPPMPPAYTTGGGMDDPDPLPSPKPRPGGVPLPRGSGRGGWPEGGKGKKGGGRKPRAKTPEYVDITTGKAITPTEDQLYFLNRRPEPRRFQDLEAFEKAADGIEKRNNDLMESLQRGWLQASEQRIALIQLDRDAAIKALDEQELSEEQHAQAVSLIRQTAGAEIVTEARRLVETTDKTTEATYKLSDTFQGFGQVASSAFEDAIVKGGKFSDMLNGLAEDIQRLLIRNTLNKFLDIAINAGGAALTGWLGGGTTTPTVQQHQANIQNILRGGGTTNALGNAFDHGNVIPFARGGVVSRPTVFPMARGMGLMGEAGPEAVVPLKRMPSGNLGVEGTAGGVTVNIINNTPSKVTTEEKKGDPKGGVNLNVVIDSLETAMAQRLQRPGSQLNRAMVQAANPIKAR